MTTPTIPNGETQFFPIIYEGNGAGQRVGKFVPFTDNGTIANSCLFNSADSAYLTRTPSSSGSGTTFTVSFWFKIGKLGHSGDLFSNSPSGSAANIFYLTHHSDNTILIHGFNSGGGFTLNLQTTRTFEDTSKWYHLLCAVDTTQSTSTDRVKLYIDGSQITAFSSTTYPGSSDNFGTNQSGVPQLFGRYNYDGTRYHDGYIAEANMVDGTALTPSTFGVVDTSTGRWIPKTLTGITYGTNGFRLKFQDSSALGDDTGGGGNDFTATNLTATDQRTDSPSNNFPTIRPYNPSYSQTFSEGNLQHATGGTNVGYPVVSTLRPKESGKFYAECRISATPGGNTIAVGCYQQEDLHNYSSGNAYPGNANYGSGLWISSSPYVRWNGQTSYANYTPFTFSAGDVIGLALDLDTGLLSFYDDDNGLIGSVTYDRTKSACFGAMSNTTITFIWNFGDNPTFNGNETAGGNADEDGNGNFFKSVPTGFKVLKQDNMPETAKGITGFTWIKARDSALNWNTYDSSNGVFNRLVLNSTSSILNTQGGVSKFLKGGIVVGDTTNVNNSGSSMMSYNWVANGGTTASNTDGSITSTVQANTTAGFSIMQYTGTGSNATVGHGLSSAPDWVMLKNLDQSSSGSGDWMLWHKEIPNTKYLSINDADAPATLASAWNSTSPTSSVISIGTATRTNNSGDNHIIYAWHEVDGFSKFGKYVGNGVVDGPFIYTGFKVKFLMHKANNGAYWYIYDTTREPNNPVLFPLFANATTAESSNVYGIDLLSNGFKMRQPTGYGGNYSGVEVYYWAFAEHPFVGDGTSPTTAR